MSFRPMLGAFAAIVFSTATHAQTINSPYIAEYDGKRVGLDVVEGNIRSIQPPSYKFDHANIIELPVTRDVIVTCNIPETAFSYVSKPGKTRMIGKKGDIKGDVYAVEADGCANNDKPVIFKAPPQYMIEAVRFAGEEVLDGNAATAVEFRLLPIKEFRNNGPTIPKVQKVQRYGVQIGSLGPLLAPVA